MVARRVPVCLVLVLSLSPVAWAERLYPQTGPADAISDTALPLIGATVAGLWVFGGTGEVETARRCTDGLITTGALVQGLKALIGDDRPNDASARDGFPSGHTALAFCTATVLAERDELADPLAYLWAASVGWSRVELGEHTWAQVLTGAAIGYLLGRESSHGDGLLGNLIVPDAPGAAPSGFVSTRPTRAPGLALITLKW